VKSLNSFRTPKSRIAEADVRKLSQNRVSKSFETQELLRHIPRNSHFKFNFLASMASFEELASGYFKGLGAWFNNGFYTYLLLQESHDISGLEKQLPAFVQKYMAESFSVVSKSAYELDLNLEPLTDIYLRSNLSNQVEPVSDIRYVYIFSAIAFFMRLNQGVGVNPGCEKPWSFFSSQFLLP